MALLQHDSMLLGMASNPRKHVHPIYGQISMKTNIPNSHFGPELLKTYLFGIASNSGVRHSPILFDLRNSFTSLEESLLPFQTLCDLVQSTFFAAEIFGYDPKSQEFDDDELMIALHGVQLGDSEMVSANIYISEESRLPILSVAKGLDWSHRVINETNRGPVEGMLWALQWYSSTLRVDPIKKKDKRRNLASL